MLNKFQLKDIMPVRDFRMSLSSNSHLYPTFISPILTQIEKIFSLKNFIKLSKH